MMFTIDNTKKVKMDRNKCFKTVLYFTAREEFEKGISQKDGASLVVHCLRIHLPMQGTRV